MMIPKTASIVRAIRIWNQLTNPSVPRTESMHTSYQKRARMIMKFIRDNSRLSQIGERSNGALYWKG